MKTLTWLATLSAMFLLVGCDEPAPSGTTAGTRSSAPPPPAGTTGRQGVEDVVQPPTQTAPRTQVPNQPADAGETYERDVVAVGADRRGRNYGGGVITEPIRQYFRAGQRINLLNLKRAMDLYKAGNNNQLPKTHEQFMKEIVEANGIELPQLPEGERYVFDPERGELMVERPQR